MRRGRPGPGRTLRALADPPPPISSSACAWARHVDGLVDFYYGPPELHKRIEAEELHAPAALATDAASLAESLDGLTESRRRWLETQLRSLETVARKLAGEEIDYEHEFVGRDLGRFKRLLTEQLTPDDLR